MVVGHIYGHSIYASEGVGLYYVITLSLVNADTKHCLPFTNKPAQHLLSNT